MIKIFLDELSYSLFRAYPTRISARNILKGKIVKITRGAVNAEVTLELQVEPSCFGPSQAHQWIIWVSGGKEAYAVVKDSSVMIAVD